MSIDSKDLGGRLSGLVSLIDNSKKDGKTKIKNALLISLIYSLEHPTNITKLYDRANEVLHKHTRNGGFNQTEIDELAREVLLTDHRIVEKIKKYYCSEKTRDIKFTSYGVVYRLLSRFYFGTPSFRKSARNEKLRLPPNFKVDVDYHKKGNAKGCNRSRGSNLYLSRI